MSATYLQGVIEAESRLKTFNGDALKVYEWLNNEAQLLSSDYRWNNWLNGAHDFIVFHIRNKPKQAVLNELILPIR